MRSALSAIIVSSALAMPGCAHVAGGCPPLVTYSAAQQDKAADELAALPRGAQIGIMIVDYGKMRDACRPAS